MAADAYAYCESLVREGDKTRFLTSLFAPADARPHLFALYAFNVEIARVRDAAREAAPGEIRLQWWHDALAGHGHGEVTANPVADALLETLAQRRVPVQPLVDLIEARRFDLYREPMGTIAELEAYLRATSSGVIATAAAILGGGASTLAPAADAAGLAQGLPALLNAIAPHAARGQIHLPLDVLARHGVAAHDVLAGHDSAGLQAALADLRGLSRRSYDEFLARVADVPAAARPAFLTVALVPNLLSRLERSSDPFAPIEVPQWRQQLTLLRTAWLGFPKI